MLWATTSTNTSVGPAMSYAVLCWLNFTILQNSV